jgi:hypothetical protein
MGASHGQGPWARWGRAFSTGIIDDYADCKKSGRGGQEIRLLYYVYAAGVNYTNRGAEEKDGEKKK